MRRHIRKIVALVLVIAMGVVGIAALMNPLRFETVTCSPDTVAVSFIEQGTYDYIDEYEVLSLISGEVLDIKVKEGDTIKKGDVIATVDASDYEYQLNQMKAQIEGYEGNLEDLEAQQQQRRDSLQSELEALNGQLGKLEAEARASSDSNEDLSSQIEIQRQIVANNERMERDAKNELSHVEQTGDTDMIASARTTYTNAQNATAASILSLQQLEAGLTGSDVYESQRQSLESQIARLSAQMDADYTDGMKKYYESQIQSAEAGIDQLRGKAEKGDIVSNVGGVIVGLPIKKQNTVSQQSKVATIADSPQVEVYVPTREIGAVHIGDKAELLLDTRMGTEIAYATVADIADNAEVRKSALGVEERRVRVLLEPDTEDLIIGYTMDVRFTIYTQEEAIELPKTSVFAADGGDYVWVIAGGRLRRQSVTKGMETNDGIIIDDGVRSGDVVVRDAGDKELVEGRRAEGV